MKNSYNKKYHLNSIVNHIGNLEIGHYYSTILHNNKWYNYNDLNISEVETSNIINNNNYILYYFN